MPDITAEKQKFLSENLDKVRMLVERENVSRGKAGVGPLTEEEIDAAVGELMSSDVTFNTYTFEEPQRAEKPRPVPVGIFRFEIQRCANGFLMSVLGDNSGKYIFKTQRELGRVFDRILWGNGGSDGRGQKVVVKGGVRLATYARVGRLVHPGKKRQVQG